MVTANFSKQKRKTYQVGIQIWHYNISALLVYGNAVPVVYHRHAQQAILQGMTVTWERGFAKMK